MPQDKKCRGAVSEKKLKSKNKKFWSSLSIWIRKKSLVMIWKSQKDCAM